MVDNRRDDSVGREADRIQLDTVVSNIRTCLQIKMAVHDRKDDATGSEADRLKRDSEGDDEEASRHSKGHSGNGASGDGDRDTESSMDERDLVFQGANEAMVMEF